MANDMIQKAAANQVAKKPGKTTADLMKAMAPEIAKALPSVMTPERFTRIAMTALNSNPALQRCEPMSFIGAMMQAAQLGVEVNNPLGQAYLIPYAGKVQFQLGYKGLIDLAYRSGQVSTIQAHAVYSNDEFHYQLGLEPKLEHIPAVKDRGEVISYYAVVKMKDGGFAFEVMSKEDVMKHARKYSKSFNNGPWQTDFDEMAKKTVLKAALKYCPLKSDFVKGVVADETVKSSIDVDMYSVPDETIYDVDQETGEVVEEDKTNG
ncbi:MAG TPA: recombinase RecT [Methanocorpusculum sp.]|nr:recombinase RecT [Methanocorpusculum sp.]